MDNLSGTSSFDEYVKLSVESGISPLELVFKPIVECETGMAFAFRTETVVNSVISGTLTEADYTGFCDGRETGMALFKRSIRRVIWALKSFKDCNPPIKFLALRCPSEAVERSGEDLFSVVSAALKENPKLNPSALCLEFPASLLEKQTEKARTALMDMKILKVKTMLTGCGKEDFPVSKLVTVPPDYVVLDKAATQWAGSRDKPQLVPALVAYLKSMGIEAIAEGESGMRRALRNSDCVGFTESGRKPLTLKEAVDAAKENEEL